MNIEIKDSAVFRDGAQIATIQDGKCYSAEPIAGRVKGAINEANGEKLTFVVGDVPQDEAEWKDSQPEVKEPPPVPAQPETTLSGIDRLTALVDAGKIPPPPRTRPDMGDKTPEYVAWFREHATPEEFTRKYQGRKLPTHEEADAGERERIRRRDLAGGFDTLRGEPLNEVKRF